MIKKTSDKKKYWLKGGILGVIIGSVLHILGWMIQYSFIRNVFPYNFRFFITSPMCYSSATGYQGVCFVLLGLISNVIIFGLIGIFIGWIYGKIKRS